MREQEIRQSIMEKTLKVINELKSKKLIDDYAIGGGIATLFYIEPFLTYDLDVFIIVGKKACGECSRTNKEKIISLTPIFTELEKMGYSFKGEHIVIEGLPVQFIPADELEEEAMRNARGVEYEKTKTKIFAPEYLIAIFLRAGREKDIYKVKKLIEQVKVDRKKLNEILKRYKLRGKLKS